MAKKRRWAASQESPEVYLTVLTIPIQVCIALHPMILFFLWAGRGIRMNLIKHLFAQPDLLQSAGAIIWWWEERRPFYNLILVTWVLLLAFVASALSRPFDTSLWNSNVLLVFVVCFVIPANILYTGGWIVDLIVKKVLGLPARGFGPWALGVGIAFTLALYLTIFVGSSLQNFGDRSRKLRSE